MDLRDERLLFLDCQTTGMRPSAGHLLELAWGAGSASREKLDELHCELVKLPEGESIPRSVREITGISEEDLVEAVSRAEVYRKLETGRPARAIIHYAQFEKPFLKHLYLEQGAGEELPFEIFCTSQISKKLFPQLPSRNIRALAGYFGLQVGEMKRASSHVQGTFEIWRGIVAELEKRGVRSFAELEVFLKEAPKEKNQRYEYRISKETRLALPEQPGVYRMLAKSGKVLYVGKATSLRDRVNSYFRGKKGRDPRKLEMLAQVWNLEVTPTATPLEAALLENEEIKKFNPPYNVALKENQRRMLFYSRDFSASHWVQDESHPLGPFRPNNPIEQLRMFLDWRRDPSRPRPIFFEPVPNEVLIAGWNLYREENGECVGALEPRKLLAWGMSLLRTELREEKALALAAEAEMEEELADLTEESDFSEDEEATEERTWTAEEISEKFGRLFLRAARESRRAKMLTRLLNCRVRWQLGNDWRSLEFHEGKLAKEPRDVNSRPNLPWRDLNIVDYDRMSILLSEISRHPHQIQRPADFAEF